MSLPLLTKLKFKEFPRGSRSSSNLVNFYPHLCRGRSRNLKRVPTKGQGAPNRGMTISKVRGGGTKFSMQGKQT